MEILDVPRVGAIHAAAIDPDNGDAVIAFKTADGNAHALRLPPGVIPALVATLISLSHKFPPGAREASGQPVVLRGAQPFLVKEKPDAAGLMLDLEGGLKLPVVFGSRAIPSVRAALTRLEQLLKSARAAKPPAKPH